MKAAIQTLEKSDFLQYGGGLKNFYEAIEKDCVEVMAEHMKRIAIDLDHNFQNGFFIMELPLIRAIKFHSYNALVLLLESHADMDAMCLDSGMSPYEYAMENNKKVFNIFETCKKGEDIGRFKTIPKTVMFKEENQEKKRMAKVREYKKGDKLNFISAISGDDVDMLERHWNDSHFDLDENYVYPMPPTFLDCIPLIISINSKAYGSLRWLLEKKASLNKICRKTWMNAVQYAEENDKNAYRIIQDFIGK